MTKEDITLKNEGLKVYEIGYLLLPSVEESKVIDEVSKIRTIIEKNNSMFVSEGGPQMKILTYPMVKVISSKNQKFDSAYFGWIKFESDSESILKIKEELDKLENILRSLIIKTVKENTMITPKAGKFSFDKSGKKEKKKDEKEDENIKEKDKKELDETIEELVIE